MDELCYLGIDPGPTITDQVKMCLGETLAAYLVAAAAGIGLAIYVANDYLT